MPRLHPELNLLKPRQRHRLDEHLDDVAAVLRLDEDRRALAEHAAGELRDWIESAPELRLLRPVLYPQGSFLIRTTVRPRKQGRDVDEFDLDIVIEFIEGWSGSPDQLFELLWRRIRAHPEYGVYAERKRRCIRVNFPGEFHLDVLPARPDEHRRRAGHLTAIEVPDRRLHEWKESDPMGFAGWFDNQSKIRVREKLSFADQRLLPQDDDAALDALRKCVQLTKRHRDVVFNGDNDSPRSIVLTTLHGVHYVGVQSIYVALLGGVSRILEWSEEANGVPVVLNPVNEEENFAEAWNDESFNVFRTFVESFQHKLVDLGEAYRPSELKGRLAELFDERIASQAMERFGERMKRAQGQREMMYEPKKKGMIVVSTVTGRGPTDTARPIPRGTNYGS